MSAALAWEAFDPAYTPAGPDTSVVGAAPPVSGSSSSSGLPFFHPQHELFGFGVLVVVTATAMYLASGGGAGGRVKAEGDIGGVKAEGDIGAAIGGDDK